MGSAILLLLQFCNQQH